MSRVLNNVPVQTLRQHILEAVLYFDVFSYPMTREEIHQLTGIADIDFKEVDAELDKLIQENVLFQHEQFILASPDTSPVTLRINRNKRADRYLKVAHRIGRFIHWFPFCPRGNDLRLAVQTIYA